LAAPLARDLHERDTATTPAADRRQLVSSAGAGAMFSTTPDQYEQFVRLQQLLMHMQTSRLLQPSDNGAQVRNVVNQSPAECCVYR